MNAPANIRPDSDDAFRQSVVGASEVPALFDASPWLTRFELHHRKAGAIDTPAFNAVDASGKPENERIYWGVKLEPVVLEGACERYGYQRIDTPRRLNNGAGLGGHPDAIVICPERGRGIVEVKTVDWLVEKSWGDEPPTHYLLQAQVYAGLAGVAWCDLVWLTSGNKLNRHRESFRPTLFAEIERRVTAFWADVHAGRAPEPDYRRDGDTIAEVLGEPEDALADLRGDSEADELATAILAAKADEKAAKERAEEAKNRLLMKIGTADRALLGLHRIGCAQTKGSADRIAKPGEIIKGRRGYRRFDVREIQS